MKKCILIIDDSPDLNRLMATILTGAGFDTISALTGQAHSSLNTRRIWFSST